MVTKTYNPYVFSSSVVHKFERYYLSEEKKNIRTSKLLLENCIEWCDYRTMVTIYFNTIMHYEYTVNEFIKKVRKSNKDINELIPWFSDYTLFIRNSRNKTPINFRSDKFIIQNEILYDNPIIGCIVVGLNGSTLVLESISS